MKPEAVLDQIIRTRRTIGSFLPDPIELEIVEHALELACWAPNHRKTEPWRFAVLGPQTQRKLIDLNSRLVSASKGEEAAEVKRQQWSRIPGWIAVTCLRSDDAFLAEEDYPATCCAIQNLMLTFWSYGIGTKWSTGEMTRHSEYFKLLDIDPAEQRSVGLIWYGKPQSVPEQKRRPVTDFAQILP